MLIHYYTIIKSRHTVVCRAAQEASAPYPWGRTMTQFSRILVRNWMIFAMEMPSAVSTLHSKFQLNCARRFRNINLQKLAQFSHFFSFFCKGVKVTINGFSDCLEIWYKDRWWKGASWYQVWLKYDKHSKNYLWLFTKNSTNMLSCPQGKPCIARRVKLVQR